MSLPCSRGIRIGESIVLIKNGLKSEVGQTRPHLTDASSPELRLQSTTAMADDIVLPIPNLSVAQNVFILSNPSLSRLHDEAREKALKAIQEDGVYSPL